MIWVELVMAQAALFLVRPRVARRLGPRLLHALPFVAVALLGTVLSEFFASSGLGRVERLCFGAVTALLVLQLCVVALVQNDAFDAREDGRPKGTITPADATYFTTVGGILVCTLLAEYPGLGAPAALFFGTASLYSHPVARLKRSFPLNYTCEGVSAWAAFVLGGSALLSVAPERELSPQLILSSGVVFAAWFVFNAFKDYKDIRRDFLAGNQTLYVMALRRGYRLSTLHRALRAILVVSMLIPTTALGVAGVGWLGLLLSSAVTGLVLWRALGGPPSARTVRAFLWVVSAYIFTIAALVEARVG